MLPSYLEEIGLSKEVAETPASHPFPSTSPSFKFWSRLTKVITSPRVLEQLELALSLEWKLNDSPSTLLRPAQNPSEGN